MPVIPFIPAIVGGVSAISGGKASTASAMERSPEEQAALTGGQQAGTALAGMGKGLYGTGTGMVAQGQATLQRPTSYYQRLLSGNRALMSQAVSAPRGAISDVYRGAERNLERGGVRGAQRDVARGELGRERAGAISSLITGVQPGAAAALTDIGQTQTGQGAGIAGQGISATQGAGNIYANLLGQGAQNRQYARGEGEKFGAGFGGLIFDLLSGARSGGGKNPVPGVGKWSPGPF